MGRSGGGEKGRGGLGMGRRLEVIAVFSVSPSFHPESPKQFGWS